MNHYTIGVEVDSARAVGIAFTADGRELHRAETSFRNPIFDQTTAAAHIVETVLACRQRDMTCLHVVAGVSGRESPALAKALSGEIGMALERQGFSALIQVRSRGARQRAIEGPSRSGPAQRKAAPRQGVSSASQYVIGIDAGGTSTLAVAYAPDGHELYRAERPFGNPMINRAAAVSHIAEAALACLQEGMTCTLVLAGVSGGEGSVLAKALPKEIAAALTAGGLSAPVCVISDARLALRAHLGNRNGILLISGTGSIAYGQADGQLGRSGGWGSLLGDEGSGYDIARRAVRLLLQRADEGRPHTAFLHALYAHMGTTLARDCVDVFHKRAKGENAALAEIADRFAREGDEDAQKILRRAGCALAETVATLHARLGLSPRFPLATVGSVARKAYLVRETMEAALRAKGLEPEAVEPVSPTFAAVREG